MLQASCYRRLKATDIDRPKGIFTDHRDLITVRHAKVNKDG